MAEQLSEYLVRLECDSISDYLTLSDAIPEASFNIEDGAVLVRCVKNEDIKTPTTDSSKMLYSMDLHVSEPLVYSRRKWTPSDFGDPLLFFLRQNASTPTGRIDYDAYRSLGSRHSTNSELSSLVASGFMHVGGNGAIPIDRRYKSASKLRHFMSNHLMAHPYINFATAWIGISQYAVLPYGGWCPESVMKWLCYIQDGSAMRSGVTAMGASVSYDPQRTSVSEIIQYAKGACLNLSPVAARSFLGMTLRPNPSGSFPASLGLPHPVAQLIVFSLVTFLPWILTPLWEANMPFGLYSASTFAVLWVVLIFWFPPRDAQLLARLKLKKNLGQVFRDPTTLLVVIKGSLMLIGAVLSCLILAYRRIELFSLSSDLLRFVNGDELDDEIIIHWELDMLHSPEEITSQMAARQNGAKTVLRMQTLLANIAFNQCVLIIAPRIIKCMRHVFYSRRFMRNLPDYFYRGGQAAWTSQTYQSVEVPRSVTASEFSSYNVGAAPVETRNRLLLGDGCVIKLRPGDVSPADGLVLHATEAFRAEEDVVLGSGSVLYANDFPGKIREGSFVSAGNAFVRLEKAPAGFTRSHLWRTERLLAATGGGVTLEHLRRGFMSIFVQFSLAATVWCVMRFFTAAESDGGLFWEHILSDILVVYSLFSAVELLASPLHLLPRRTTAYGGGLAAAMPRNLVVSPELEIIRRSKVEKGIKFSVVIWGLEALMAECQWQLSIVARSESTHKNRVSQISAMPIELVNAIERECGFHIYSPSGAIAIAGGSECLSLFVAAHRVLQSAVRHSEEPATLLHIGSAFLKFFPESITTREDFADFTMKIAVANVSFSEPNHGGSNYITTISADCDLGRGFRKFQINFSAESSDVIEELQIAGTSRHIPGTPSTTAEIWFEGEHQFTAGLTIEWSLIQSNITKYARDLFSPVRPSGQSHLVQELEPNDEGRLDYDDLPKVAIGSSIVARSYLDHILTVLQMPHDLLWSGPGGRRGFCYFVRAQMTEQNIVWFSDLDGRAPLNWLRKMQLGSNSTAPLVAAVCVLPCGRALVNEIERNFIGSPSESDNSYVSAAREMQPMALRSVMEYLSQRYVRSGWTVSSCSLAAIISSLYVAGIVWSATGLPLSCLLSLTSDPTGSSVLKQPNTLCTTPSNGEEAIYSIMLGSLVGFHHYPWAIFFVIIILDVIRMHSLDPSPVDKRKPREVVEIGRDLDVKKDVCDTSSTDASAGVVNDYTQELLDLEQLI